MSYVSMYNFLLPLGPWDYFLRLYWRMKHTGPKVRVGGRSLAFPTSIHLGLPHMTEEEKKKRLKPFAILVSVYNAEGYIGDFLESFKPYLDKLLVVDDCSTDGTYRVLERYGVRYLRNDVNINKPASIKRALEVLPEEVETVIVTDPDCFIVESGLKGNITDIEEVLADFQMSGADGCMVRATIKEQGSLVTKLQDMEYRIALSLGSKALADKAILGGVAVYKRKSLMEALQRHPLSIYGEDFMTSLLMLNNGGRIYYDGRFKIETEGMNTWKGLLSQRIAWDFAYVYVYFHTLWRLLEKKDKKPLLVSDRRFMVFYNYFVCLGVFGILLHPAKLFAMAILAVSFINLLSIMAGLPLPVKGPLYAPLWFIIFYLLSAFLIGFAVFSVVEKGKRSRFWGVIAVYPVYALCLLPVRTIGFLNYFSVALLGKRIFRDRYCKKPVAQWV